jgi:DNA-binding MarR family transcriptional regulator
MARVPKQKGADRAVTGGGCSGRTDEGEAARMGDLMMRMFLHIRQRLRQLFAEENAFSLTELLVLWTISSAGPMKFHHLSRRVGVPVSTLTTLVDRMEARGFLRRRPDTEDRRAVFVEGTPSLASIRERAAAVIRGEMESVVGRLGVERARGVLAGLEVLSAALTGEPKSDVGGEDA